VENWGSIEVLQPDVELEDEVSTLFGSSLMLGALIKSKISFQAVR